MPTEARFRVGLLINPYAGLGGPLALKGSDGKIVQALAAGGQPLAGGRALQALQTLAPLWSRIDWVSAAAGLGGALLHRLGLPVNIVHQPHETPDGLASSEADTTALTEKLARAQLDLLLFAGGDGTARDVLQGLQAAPGRADQVPVIGIPAGVKMQSAVFGNSPQASALLAQDFLLNSRRVVAEREVMDLDETLLRQDIVSPQLFGYMAVPVSPRHVQGKKMRSPESDAVTSHAIAQRVVAQLQPGVTYLFGPGSTTFAVKKALGLSGSLLGVDLVRDRQLLLRDATERQIWDAVGTPPCHLFLSCIGGQGHVFGRGNTQLSPRILKQIGPEQLTVLATPGKLQSLRGRPFQVDSGDPMVDRQFSRPTRVWSGLHDGVWYRVGTTLSA